MFDFHATFFIGVLICANHLDHFANLNWSLVFALLHDIAHSVAIGYAGPVLRRLGWQYFQSEQDCVISQIQAARASYLTRTIDTKQAGNTNTLHSTIDSARAICRDPGRHFFSVIVGCGTVGLIGFKLKFAWLLRVPRGVAGLALGYHTIVQFIDNDLNGVFN